MHNKVLGITLIIVGIIFLSFTFLSYYQENTKERKTIYTYIEVRKNAAKQRTLFDKMVLTIENENIATLKFYWPDKVFSYDDVITFIIIPEYVYNFYTEELKSD